jgi:hypothetical protein
MNIYNAFCIYIGSAIILSASLYLSDAKLGNSRSLVSTPPIAQSPEQEKPYKQQPEINLASLKPSGVETERPIRQ